jgi:hypothetical protein
MTKEIHSRYRRMTKEIKEFTVSGMLDNAACSSQHLPLIEDKVLRGAILRSVRQWLVLRHYKIEDAIQELELHQDFNK